MIGKSGVFIIAEAGVNHNGDIDLAKKLVDSACEAGVDAVKFQTWKTELVVTQDVAQAEYQSENIGESGTQYRMLKALELSYEDFRELKAYCDAKGILFLSTADEPQSAEFLLELQDIFKIGSGEITNIPFLRYMGSLGKELILSSGIATLGEVDTALRTIIQAGTPKERITLLHVTTQYPTPMNEVNLRAMQTMREAFGIKVGYSDHTMGIEVPIAAVALGACIIEKHFTLSRKMQGPDHKASLEPHELKAMVTAIRNIEAALGNGIKEPQPSELANKAVVQKFILAACEIKKGQTLTPQMLFVKRASGGIPSS
ncbi:MAG: N-acetylneuraminate synthase, partial [Epsilonproteobacteria bacterium]|nr:N-acetylneuraminate synthase [Campylobacterota bacterium]